MTDKGSCGLQGKLVLIGGLVWCKLYHPKKIGKVYFKKTNKNMFPEHVSCFLFIYIQSPYHFIFPDFKNRTWLHFMCSVQTKKEKGKKKDRNYNQNFNVKFNLIVLVLVFWWARHVKTCNKKGEAEMHWTAGQLAGLLRHPFVPDCIPLYHRISFNLFLNYFKLYLIVNNDKLRIAPRCLFRFTQTCPVYRLLTVTL